MPKTILCKIGGEAGFGIMTTGLMLSKLAARFGYNIYDYAEYPSLIRGGLNTYAAQISITKTYSLKEKIDLLVCLNEKTFLEAKDKLNAHSLVVFDPSEFQVRGNYCLIKLPLAKIRAKYGASKAMENMIALGTMTALIDLNKPELNKIVKQQFKSKGNKVVVQNQKLASAGYDYVERNYANEQFNLDKPKLNKKNKLVITGNEAFSLGAVMADCRFYAAYPMTPSSSVLGVLAAWQKHTGMVVRHAEDEIAVINSALGASFAGVRAAVGTSGGGFALMTETVSLAGLTELPLVIFLSQRPGPATGMPTWTEQGDLLFSIYSGHGEFPKIVLAPGDVKEMYSSTLEAFNLADYYQTPVIILSDKLLSESHQTLTESEINTIRENHSCNQGKIVEKSFKKPYLRYRLSPDGISELLVPGAPSSYYQANSYEHLEDSHTTEDSQIRVEQVKKRAQKRKTYIKKHYQPPNIYGDLNKAELIFVSWGSQKGAIVEAMEQLKQSTALIHFTHIFPLETELIKPLFNLNKQYILVENNSTGQFGKLLRQETGIKIKQQLLKFNGRPWWSHEIVNLLTTNIK